MAVQEEELSFNDYVSVLKRRWLTVLMVAVITTIAVIVVTLNLPLIFTSVGRITIESPIVDRALFERDRRGSDVSIYVGERIDKIKKKTLSTKNLIAISKKYNLFPGITEPKEIVKGVRDAISITYDKKSADGTEWGTKVTTGFVVEVEFSDAQNAYNIANEIVTNLLNENTKDRSARATENTSFLTSQLKEIKANLEAVENKVADFKQAHTDSLPEHQDMHMTMLDQLRTTSKNLDQEYKDTQEELRYLDVEYSTSVASSATGQDSSGQLLKLSPLEEAKAELSRSLVLYKDTHPTIRALKRKVALLEQSNDANKSEADKKSSSKNILSEIALVKIKTQIESAQARLDSITKQKRSILAEMHKVQQQVMKIPEVERGLTALLRDYANAKQKYEEVKSKQINAQIAEKLETQNKGERFILEVSPEIPENRTSPQRTKIVLIGTLAAMGLGIAVALVLEFLEQRVRGLYRITSIINMKPIAVIPHIDTNDEIAKRKKLFKYAYIAAVVLVSLIIIAAIVIFFVTPSK